jgi:PAS domain S-box-containing protein
VHEIFAEQAWLATMLKSLSDAIVATDANGYVSYLNPPAEALTGWSLKDALGLPIERIYSLSTLAGEKVEECQLRMASPLKKRGHESAFC